MWRFISYLIHVLCFLLFPCSFLSPFLLSWGLYYFVILLYLPLVEHRFVIFLSCLEVTTCISNLWKCNVRTCTNFCVVTLIQRTVDLSVAFTSISHFVNFYFSINRAKAIHHFLILYSQCLLRLNYSCFPLFFISFCLSLLPSGIIFSLRDQRPLVFHLVRATTAGFSRFIFA